MAFSISLQMNCLNKHYYSIHTKQSNEFQYQNTHQDLLHMPHHLFYLVDYL